MGNIFSVDLTNVPTNNFELLPLGVYIFQIVEARKEIGQQAPHNTYIALRLKPIEDMDGNEVDSKVYGMVFSNLVLTEKALFRVKEFFLALGVTEEQMEAGELEIDIDDLINKEIIASIKHVKYDDRMKVEIKKFIVPTIPDAELEDPLATPEAEPEATTTAE